MTTKIPYNCRIRKGELIGPSPVCRPHQTIYRPIREIERTLRRGANTLYTKYNKEEVEEYKLEIQEILGVFNIQSSPLNHESHTAIESHASAAPIAPSDAATMSVVKGGTSSPHFFRPSTQRGFFPDLSSFLNFSLSTFN